MKEAYLYDKLENSRVLCRACNHFCRIEPGRTGICNVRENQEGTLVSLVHDKVIATSVDPVEKKPFFHVLPGSKSYSIATMGCNFKCGFCQNADIAHTPASGRGYIQGREILPETIVAQALATGCKSIAYTYTEPSVFFELALDTAMLAREKGLLNLFVTNGYMSRNLIETVSPFLDGANVDLKAFNDEFYRTHCHARLDPVRKTLKLMRESGVLVEVTTLLIPGLNDDPGELADMSVFIANELGPETPWHISRFHPAYKMQDRRATKVSSLEKAMEAGKKAGLFHVYTGNVPGHAGENTNCRCGTRLVSRQGYDIENFIKDNGTCPHCNIPVYGLY